MRHLAFAAAAALLSGCKENLLEGVVDASVDAPDVVLPPGNFSCLGQPYSTTAPDPLLVRGYVGFQERYGGVTVEVRDAQSDALVFDDVTATGIDDRAGRYSENVVTGGRAPLLYRRAIGSQGRLDSYSFDGIPVSSSYDMGTIALTDAQTQAYYTVASVPREPSKGQMIIDVFDCNIPPMPTRKVAHATIVAPSGATVLYTAEDGTIGPADLARTETSAAGTVVILNVTPGVVDLDIQVGTVTYRSWPVRVFANSWTIGPRHP